MKDLRERCKNVFDNCMGLDVPGGQEWKQIESFAREIRNEALEEAANLIDSPRWRCMYGFELHEQIRALKSDSTETLAAKESSDG